MLVICSNVPLRQAPQHRAALKLLNNALRRDSRRCGMRRTEAINSNQLQLDADVR